MPIYRVWNRLYKVFIFASNLGPQSHWMAIFSTILDETLSRSSHEIGMHLAYIYIILILKYLSNQ